MNLDHYFCPVHSIKCVYKKSETICPCGGGQSCVVDRRRNGDPMFGIANSWCDCMGPSLSSVSPLSDTTTLFQVCSYGAVCTRKNFQHIKDCFHPLGHKYTTPDGKHICPFAKLCTNSEVDHKDTFLH
jgi:hypothetical protein